MDELETVVGRRRGGKWRKLGYGVYRSRLPDVSADRSSVGDAAAGALGHALGQGRTEGRDTGRRDRLADLRAWQHALPEGCCFTHLTAAEVHGLWLPPIPTGLPVVVALPKTETRPKRPELRVLRSTAPIEPVTVGSVRVAPLPEVLLACARDLGLLDLGVLLDAALRRPDCTRSGLDVLAGSRRWGAPAMRAALSYADPRSESPWETVLRLFHALCDVPVEPQFEVYDERGVFVARGDLRISGTRTLHEYDGAVHRDRRAHASDLARDRRLVNNGWVRRGYTAADLLSRSHLVLREADAAVGRPHDSKRLRPWLDALGRSLFSSTGRRRLLERWGVG